MYSTAWDFSKLAQVREEANVACQAEDLRKGAEKMEFTLACLKVKLPIMSTREQAVFQK